MAAPAGKINVRSDEVHGFMPNPPETPRKSSWCDCFKSHDEPKHSRKLTKWEVDYTIHLRTKSAFQSSQATDEKKQS